MNHTEQPSTPWARLTAAARLAPAESEAAPFGFAGRVVAQAWAQAPARPSWSLALDRWSWPALGVAALLVIACLAASYPALASYLGDDDLPCSNLIVAMAEAS